MQQQATRVPYDQSSTNFRVYELVAAGAIGIVLKLIHSVSQSELDNEVLKHALSTLQNVTRYQHLIKY